MSQPSHAHASATFENPVRAGGPARKRTCAGTSPRSMALSPGVDSAVTRCPRTSCVDPARSTFIIEPSAPASMPCTRLITLRPGRPASGTRYRSRTDSFTVSSIRSRSERALGLFGPVPARVSAQTKLRLLGLIEQAVSDGWAHTRACRVLDLADSLAHHWRQRPRETSSLEDGIPVACGAWVALAREQAILAHRDLGLGLTAGIASSRTTAQISRRVRRGWARSTPASTECCGRVSPRRNGSAKRPAYRCAPARPNAASGGRVPARAPFGRCLPAADLGAYATSSRICRRAR
jgi:hypothetical protein